MGSINPIEEDGDYLIHWSILMLPTSIEVNNKQAIEYINYLFRMFGKSYAGYEYFQKNGKNKMEYLGAS